MQIRERKLLSIILLVTVVTFIGIFQACSSGSPDSSNIPQQTPAPDQKPLDIADTKPEPTEDPVDLGFDQEEIGEEDTAMVDQGTPCRNHRYFILPGTSESLSFETVLSGTIAGDFSPASLELKDDVLEDSELEANLGPAEIITASTSYPIWIVDGKAFYDKTIAQGMKPTVLRVKNISIKWNEDGTGVLTRILSQGNPRSVGRYSEKELKREIGEDLVIRYTPPGSKDAYAWELRQDTREDNSPILKFELNVDLPSETTNFKSKSLIITGGPIGWTIKITYSKARNRYIVTGPATSAECLEGNE